MHHEESFRPAGRYAAITCLRVILQLLNVALAVCGLAVVMYSTFMYGEWRHGHAHKEATPWFIYVFGSAGLFTLATSVAGLIGSSQNSGLWLAVYSFMAVVLLLAQVAAALLLFFGKSWQNRLPHDDTGEAQKIEHWIKSRMDICQWVGLGLVVTQVVAVVVAFFQSRMQQQMLRSESIDDEEVWGRHQPLLAAQEANSRVASPVIPGDIEASVATPDRNDPWSQRMRDKYGLDTDQFTQVPVGTAAASVAEGPRLAAHPQPPADDNGSRCAIM